MFVFVLWFMLGLFYFYFEKCLCAGKFDISHSFL